MQADLTVHYVNHVHVYIDCSDAIAQELSDFFTFFVPGYQFMPAFKSRVWDGKIRIFNKRDHSLYKGLLHKLEKFASDRNYHMVYAYEEFDNEMSLQEAELFIDSLDHILDNRDYQIEAFAKGVRKKRLILLSPTASGKSKIIYDTMSWIRRVPMKKKGLIIVPTIQLVEQIYKDFQEYSTKNHWDVDANVHRVYEGKPKSTTKQLTITTWQSMFTMDGSFFHQYDYVIGDEVHQFKAKSLTYIMENMINAEYRIGLSGSLDESLTHKMVLEGLFGPVVQVATTKELMDQKYLSTLHIKALVLKHPPSICQIASKWTYQQEIEYLIQNEARNVFIKNLALSLKGNTLVLYNYVHKHGIQLHKLIEANLPEDKFLHLVHGKTDVEVREEIRKIVSESSNNIVVASYGTTSTGINMPNLHNTIFASPSKSRIRNLQSIGRGLRIGTDGTDSHVLYDIADDLRKGKKENHTLKHFQIRLKLYASEHFDYKIYKIQLKD